MEDAINNITAEDAAAAALKAAGIQSNQEDQAEDMEEDLPVSSVAEPGMNIRSDYKRKSESSKISGFQKCPKCHRDIPLAEWSNHLKIELLDPKWREQKAEMLEKQHVGMSGDDITKNLKKLTQDHPTLYKKSIQEEITGKPTAGPKLIWDGQSEQITRTTANAAMMAQ